MAPLQLKASDERRLDLRNQLDVPGARLLLHLLLDLILTRPPKKTKTKKMWVLGCSRIHLEKKNWVLIGCSQNTQTQRRKTKKDVGSRMLRACPWQLEPVYYN